MELRGWVFLRERQSTGTRSVFGKWRRTGEGGHVRGGKTNHYANAHNLKNTVSLESKTGRKRSNRTRAQEHFVENDKHRQRAQKERGKLGKTVSAHMGEDFSPQKKRRGVQGGEKI